MKEEWLMTDQELMRTFRPGPPRFDRVGDFWRVSQLPWFSKTREVYLPLNFKRYTVEPRKVTPWSMFGTMFVDRCMAPVFQEIKSFMNRWVTSEIVNAAHYNTVQLAIDAAADQIIFVPPGTYNEQLDITNNNLTLTGHYRSTIIDGLAVAGGPAIYINGADDVTMGFITMRTTPGGGVGGNEAILVRDAPRLKLMNVFVNGSDHGGIHIHNTSPDCEILSCHIRDPDDQGIHLSTAVHRIKIIGCTIQDASGVGILQASDDGTIRGNIINTTGDDGVSLPVGADNNVVTGNRITGWTNEPIDDNGYGNDTSHNKTT